MLDDDKTPPTGGEPPQPAALTTPTLQAKPTPKPAPKKEAVAESKDISSHPLVQALREKFPGAITEAIEMKGQNILRVARERIGDVCRELKDNHGYNFLTDLTAVHHPGREKPFEVVYNLYAIEQNLRLRLKVDLQDGEPVDSVSGIWEAANWMEREVYDLFGVRFEGHPDLRRLLLPQDWQGFPLRKEYTLEFVENEWTRKHLNIRELTAEGDYTGKFE